MRPVPRLFLAASLALPLFAQQPLVEKIDVSIVNVDVTVTAAGGLPARDLTRDDFEIFEDGVRQPITNFYSIESRESRRSAEATQSVDPEDERFRRKVLLVVDNRHVTKYRRDRALSELERFIDDRFTGGSYDWSLALVSDRAHLLLPLTSDKALLHETIAEVRRLVADPGRVAKKPEYEPVTRSIDTDGVGRQEQVSTRLTDLGVLADLRAIEMDASHTVDAISSLIRSFAGTSGRKIVLIITGSLGLDDGANPLNLAGIATFVTKSNQKIAVMRAALIREANAANVSVYIINSEGLTAGDIFGASGFADAISRPMYAGSDAKTQLSSMYWVARETGGRLMPGNSIRHSLEEFDRTSSSFYSLGYRAPHGDDGVYRTIKVRLKRRGYSLQYRTGYSSVPADLQLERAMDSPLALALQRSTIPVKLQTGEATSAASSAGVLVPLRASVPAKHLQFVPTAGDSIARVDFIISIFDEHGKKVGGDRFARDAHSVRGGESEGDFVDSAQVLIRRGAPYQIVVAVHDQISGAIGISSQTVKY